jgi:cytochrome c553
MRHLLTATALVSLAGLAGLGGCVEPIDSGTTNPSLPKTAGERQFDGDVSPMLEQVCAGCHTGAAESTPTKFLGQVGASDNYAKVTFDDGVIGGWNPALAAILTQGEHDDGLARAWTAAEAGRIEDWMAQEAIDRDILIEPPVPPPPPGPAVYDARQALAKFSACMTYADWTSSQMATWANKQANGNNGANPCSDCHSAGAGGAWMSRDEAEMFAMNRQELFIKNFFAVKPKNLGDLTQGYEVIINDAKLLMKSTRQGDGHPNFNYTDGDTYRQRLVDFYQKTTARLETCTAAPDFPTAP